MPRRFLPALRGRPPTVETKALSDRVRSTASRYTVSGQPYEQKWNVDRAVREGFQSNPWVFRAIEVIAYTIIDRKIVLRRGDPDTGDELTVANDPSRLLFCLNRRANPWETAKLWRYRLIAQFLLSSKGVYIEVSRSQAGRIAMLTLLDPDLVDIIPSPVNPISAFRVRVTADTGAQWNDLPPFDPESSEQTNSVLWVRSPHPTVLYTGMSPMEAAGLSVDLDRYARLYNRNYLQADGRPGGILSIKGVLDPETAQVLEARFNSATNPGRTTAISADAMSYQDLSSTPRDMQWSDVMDRMKNEAAMVFGVPESLMGDASGRTFDNADAEYATFWEGRIGPLIGMLDDQLDVLTGGYADDLWLRHDVSDVWVLSRHEREEEDRITADYNAGLVTVDDVRVAKGLDPLDIPASRVLWLPPGKAAAGVGDDADADQKAAGALPLLGSPAPADPGAEAAAGAERGAAIAGYNAQTNATASRLRLVAGESQDRAVSGGRGTFEQRDAGHADVESKEAEGEQGRARDRPDPAPPVWR